MKIFGKIIASQQMYYFVYAILFLYLFKIILFYFIKVDSVVHFVTISDLNFDMIEDYYFIKTHSFNHILDLYVTVIWVVLMGSKLAEKEIFNKGLYNYYGFPPTDAYDKKHCYYYSDFETVIPHSLEEITVHGRSSIITTSRISSNHFVELTEGLGGKNVFIGLIGFIILVNYGHYNTSGLQLFAFGALTFITIRALWTLETTQRFILIPLGFTAGLSERVVLNIKKLSGSNLDRKKLNILIDKIREIHE